MTRPMTWARGRFRRERHGSTLGRAFPDGDLYRQGTSDLVVNAFPVELAAKAFLVITGRPMAITPAVKYPDTYRSLSAPVPPSPIPPAPTGA